MAEPTRWAERGAAEQNAYVERMSELLARRAQGLEDVDGEARLADVLAPRGAVILDAGCGPGRVAGALAERGHRAYGIDADPGLISLAHLHFPGVRTAVVDLVEATPDRLAGAGLPEAYDMIVLAGNVMVFVAPGSERRILANIRELLRPGGRVVLGFAADRATWWITSTWTVRRWDWCRRDGMPRGRWIRGRRLPTGR